MNINANLNTPAAFPWQRMTHVMEAFAVPTTSGNGIEWVASMPQRPGLITAAHLNSTRVMLSIGGADPSGSLGLAARWNTATDAGSLPGFVADIMNKVQANGYDGVDIDWEFPNANNGNVAERTQMMNLLQALYNAMHNTGDVNYKGNAYDGQPRHLTFFISPGYDICGVDWATVGGRVDYGILGGYDFNTPYNGPTSDPSPMTRCDGSGGPRCITSTVQYITACSGPTPKCFPLNKLVLAMPMYSQFPTPGGTAILSILNGGTRGSFDLPQDEERWTHPSYPGTHYLDTVQSYCRKMKWAFGPGKNMPGIALWSINLAFPQNFANTELQNIWRTIEGDPAGGCTGLPTPCLTCTACPLLEPGLIDYMDDTPQNLWGGNWAVGWVPPGSTGTMTLGASVLGDPASIYNVTPFTGPCDLPDRGTRFNGNAANAGTGVPSIITSLAPAAAQTNIGAYNSLRFRMRVTTGTEFRVVIDRQVTRLTTNNHFGKTWAVAPADLGVWKQYTFYFGDMDQAWGPYSPQGTWNDCYGIAWMPNVTGTYDFVLDDVEVFFTPATPTPSFTRTFTRTPTSTSTPAASPTFSSSATPTRSSTPSATPQNSPSYTPSPSPSRTGTPSASATPSRSPTPTLTRTASSSATLTPQSSPTSTRTGTLSRTPTSTPSVSPSASFSRTASASLTSSGTASPSRTASSSPSATPSATPSRSGTPSRTASASATQTNTPVPPGATETNTPTVSASFTRTPTASPSATRTASVTRTLTVTGSATRTSTPSVSPSHTASPNATATVTRTQSPSLTVSPALSPTSSHTASPNATATVTRTVTPSFTASPVASNTHSPTVSRTRTASATASHSATASRTRTQTGTLTGTPSATASPTQALPSPTPTRTPAPPSLLDNVEDGDSVNLWGGFWTSGAPWPSSISGADGMLPGHSPSPYGNSNAMGVNGINDPGAAYQASLATTLDSLGNPVNINAYNRVSFWFKGSSATNEFVLAIHRTATGWDDYVRHFSVAPNTWTYIELDFSDFAQEWGTPVPMDWGDVISLYWLTFDDSAFDMQIDDLEFKTSVPNTRTRTPTPSMSPSPTPTPTATLTDTPMPPGATATVTLTPEPTPEEEGPNEIVEVLPGPNPNPSAFHFHFKGGVDEVELMVYTTSMVRVDTFKAVADRSRHRQVLAIPAGAFDRLGGGTFYFCAVGRKNGIASANPFIGKFVILR